MDQIAGYYSSSEEEDTIPPPQPDHLSVPSVNTCTLRNKGTDILENSNASDLPSFFWASDSEEDVSLDHSSATALPAAKVRGIKKCTSNLPKSSFWMQGTRPVDWSNKKRIWGTSDTDGNVQTKRLYTGQTLDQRRYGQRSEEYRSQTATGTFYANTCTGTFTRFEDAEGEGPSPSEGGINKLFYVHHKISPYLDSSQVTCRVPKRSVITVDGHCGAVNRLNWGQPQYSHLLCSASMDRTVKIWNVFSSSESGCKCVGVISHHDKAVKDAVWSGNGKEIVSCSYDRTTRITDLQTGKESMRFGHKEFVTCVKIHPVNKNFVVSGSLNAIFCWDRREPDKPIKTFVYKEPFGQVQDLVFLSDGTTFFSCNDLVSRDSSDKNIMAWDFDKGVVLSNQIYQERFTCQRLVVGSHGKEILFQSQGNYIAMFSTMSPFRINKSKRYEGHKVAGYNIGCDLSRDGKLLASGCADGNLVFYDFKQGKSARKFKTVDVCMDVQWHPVLNSTLASSNWSGTISVWQ